MDTNFNCQKKRRKKCPIIQTAVIQTATAHSGGIHKQELLQVHVEELRQDVHVQELRRPGRQQSPRADEVGQGGGGPTLLSLHPWQWDPGPVFLQAPLKTTP